MQDTHDQAGDSPAPELVIQTVIRSIPPEQWSVNDVRRVAGAVRAHLRRNEYSTVEDRLRWIVATLDAEVGRLTDVEHAARQVMTSGTGRERLCYLLGI